MSSPIINFPLRSDSARALPLSQVFPSPLVQLSPPPLSSRQTVVIAPRGLVPCVTRVVPAPAPSVPRLLRVIRRSRLSAWRWFVRNEKWVGPMPPELVGSCLWIFPSLGTSLGDPRRPQFPRRLLLQLQLSLVFLLPPVPQTRLEFHSCLSTALTVVLPLTACSPLAPPPTLLSQPSGPPAAAHPIRAALPTNKAFGEPALDLAKSPAHVPPNSLFFTPTTIVTPACCDGLSMPKANRPPELSQISCVRAPLAPSHHSGRDLRRPSKPPM